MSIYRERNGIHDDAGWERCYARFERRIPDDEMDGHFIGRLVERG
jgi:hypothetical protein